VRRSATTLVVGIVSASYGFPTAIAGLALIPERRGVELA
jgi:hypothetical protein